MLHTNPRARDPLPTPLPALGWAPSRNTKEKGSGGWWPLPCVPRPLSGRRTSAPTLANAAKPCPQGKARAEQPRGTYVNDDTFVEQALLLGGHDEVVGAVLVVHDVLEVDPWKERRAGAQDGRPRLVHQELHWASLCTCRISALETVSRQTRLGKLKPRARVTQANTAKRRVYFPWLCVNTQAPWEQQLRGEGWGVSFHSPPAADAV